MELIFRLSNRGFQIRRPPVTSPLPGSTLEVTGDFARKGSCVVDLIPDLQVIGVKGGNIEEVEEIYEEVKEVILNELDINFEQEVKFYEFTGDYNIESKKKAIDCISNLFSQIEFLSKSSSILGSETSLFTIRLIPKGQIPNQAEWFDIVIEPIILRPSHFYASVVFRSKNEAKVLSFAKKSESKLLELAKIIQD